MKLSLAKLQKKAFVWVSTKTELHKKRFAQEKDLDGTVGDLGTANRAGPASARLSVLVVNNELRPRKWHFKLSPESFLKDLTIFGEETVAQHRLIKPRRHNLKATPFQ